MLRRPNNGRTSPMNSFGRADKNPPRYTLLLGAVNSFLEHVLQTISQLLVDANTCSIFVQTVPTALVKASVSPVRPPIMLFWSEATFPLVRPSHLPTNIAIDPSGIGRFQMYSRYLPYPEFQLCFRRLPNDACWFKWTGATSTECHHGFPPATTANVEINVWADGVCSLTQSLRFPF